MRTFITGQKGLIGSSLEKRLIKEGHEIVGSMDLRENNEDIININKIKKPTEKIDLLVHAAAHCKINESITNPGKTFHSDVLGTYEVFEFARRNEIPKILYFSSSRVLSKEKNPYTAAKIYGEELAKAYKDSYGIDYIIVRPSTVYGPFWDKTKRLMHIFITNALEGKPLEIYGDPKTKTLDFTYVDDFVDATILAMNGPRNMEYNISGDQENNVYDLAREIIKKTNSKSEILIRPSEIAQPQEVNCDISAIKSLGYNPKISLSQGVNECINFYKTFLNK